MGKVPAKPLGVRREGLDQILLLHFTAFAANFGREEKKS